METKLQSSEFQKRIKIPGDMFPNSCIVDCTISNSNGSGGLAMLVSKDVKIDIIAYNERVIDCYVDCSNNNVGWRASGIYGFSNNQQKPQTCDLIQNLFQNNDHDNWPLFGDFDMVINHAKKMSGKDINTFHTNMFQDVLNNCSL
jgi:hypothetical protein